MTTTTTTISDARQMAERLRKMPAVIGMPAPSSVSHPDYHVGYFHDNSILIWARGEGYIVLDEERAYYRDTVEHLARCLGMISRDRRAEIVGDKPRWIDGILWGSDGSFLLMD